MRRKSLPREIERPLRRWGVAIVYLYGSQALGKANRLSDIDVGVVFKDLKPLLRRDHRAHLRLELSRCLEPVLAKRSRRELDLVLLQTASPIFQFEVINGGYPLFVADRTFQADYEASVIEDYLDIRPLVEAHYQAVLDRAA